MAGRYHLSEGERHALLKPSTIHIAEAVRNSVSSAGSRDRGQLRVFARRRLRRQRACCSSSPALFASVAALAATVAFLALCLAAHVRKRGTGVERRILSDVGGDKELSDVLEGCVSLEEDLRIHHDASGLQGRNWPGQPMPLYEPTELIDQETSQRFLQFGGEYRSNTRGFARMESSAVEGTSRSWGHQNYEPFGQAMQWHSDQRLEGSWAGQSDSDDAANEGRHRGFGGSPHTTTQEQMLAGASLPRENVSSNAFDALAPDAWLSSIPQLLFESEEMEEAQMSNFGQSSVDNSGQFTAQQFVPSLHLTPPPAASSASPNGDDARHRRVLQLGSWNKGIVPALSSHGTQQNPPAGAVEAAIQERTDMAPTSDALASWTAERVCYSSSSGLCLEDAYSNGRGCVDTQPTAVGHTWEACEENAQQASQVLGFAVDAEQEPQMLSSDAAGPEGPQAKKMRFSERDISLHPFVRLPVVLPENVHRTFRREYVLGDHVGDTSPMQMYLTMRQLFAKPALNAEDVETLLRTAERLANYAKKKLSKRTRQTAPTYVAKRLASILMALDYLVCTIELLGDKMDTESWWQPLVQGIHTGYSLPLRPYAVPETNMLAEWTLRISAALSIYKRGVRPPLEEIVQLKRMILTRLCTNSQFENKLWNLWREDDRMYGVIPKTT
ncbi:hypothetical protein, conserved [Eimeria tenella]|uniref:Uncharacterized protein n=1 Tax=Eimeria tenella TaxID=5802 RepID=U6KT92_EIMTE|nr:hypothetical protein, conserved [Eimeria tenella]CDJ40143.1 hypothetical protein, conserved [Eimeria tenella]|eukprot:XP_013230896.1 hypothetical protein, conserved [Eimeria tenella]